MKYRYEGENPATLPTLAKPRDVQPGEVFDSDEKIVNASIVPVADAPAAKQKVAQPQSNTTGGDQ